MRNCEYSLSVIFVHLRRILCPVLAQSGIWRKGLPFIGRARVASRIVRVLRIHMIYRQVLGGLIPPVSTM